MKSMLIAGTALLIAGNVLAACPTITGKDAGGTYPHIFEKLEFETKYACQLKFAQNPAINALNLRIAGNPELKTLENRLPLEPLVIAPYQDIGQYGGVLNGISKATESGTSDLLSIRHV
ncbi:MAG: ABC transporter substrate-binding protein, partial [Oceanospirillaceae bacterium]